MRITFVLPGRGLFGGIRVVRIYADRLIARGHEVTIAVFAPPRPRRPDRLIGYYHRRYRSWRGLDRDHLDGFGGKLLCIPIAKLADRLPDADVVLATHWRTADPVMALPDRKGRKAYFLQGYEALTSPPELVDATWRLPMRKIVIARWLHRLAVEKFNDPGAVLVPNGVDPAQFFAPPRGLHDPPAVGFMFSSEPWKGTRMAMEAIRRARQQVPQLRGVSFGAFAPSAELPLIDNTDYQFRPPQERIREIYANADIWLCASTTEGFALPPLEAMACRCAVISTRCGGPEDFIEDGVNGYLVDIDDMQAMADRIVELVRDKEKLTRMAAAAYASSQRHCWEESSALMESALRDIAQGVPAPPHSSTAVPPAAPVPTPA